MTTDTRAALVDIEEADYHANLDRLSNSAIGLFLSKRRDFVRKYIDRTGGPDDAKSYFAFGGLAHAMLFEADQVAKRFAVEPATYEALFAELGEDLPKDKAGKPTNRGSGAYKRWRSLQGEKEIVDHEDNRIIGAVVDALVEHPEAREMLFAEGGLRERAIFWTDEETGEPMRARLDLHFPPGIRPLVVDLKTVEGRRADSPFEDERALRGYLYKYGYHRQAAVYSDAYREVYGVFPAVALVLAEKRGEDVAVAVKVAEPDSEIIAEGRDGVSEDGDPIGYRPALRLIRKLRESGDWRLPTTIGVQPWCLPRWREYQIQRAEDDFVDWSGVGE